MIRLYSPADGIDESDFDALRSQGERALSRGKSDEAIGRLYAALRGHAHVREDDYARVAALLRQAFVQGGHPREALTVDWYVRDRAKQEELLPRVPPVDRARTLLAWAQELGPAGARKAHEAADALESAGMLVRSAIAFERAGDWDRARALWSRLAPQLAQTHHYEAALANFNLFRASERVGDARSAKAAGIAAVHLIEEAADRHESAGQRERAFDCYRVLIAIGRATGTFEHVLEGFVNVLRILQEDHLRHYALQTFEEAVEAAVAEQELVAAATLAREMSAFARKEGEASIANHAALLEADLWQKVARAVRERGGPFAVAEHALLAAVLALGEVGQYRTVGKVYAELATLPIDDQKRAHYGRAGQRYAQARDERLEAEPVPQHLRTDSAFPDVWHVDLLEWEEAGSAAEACANILLDPGAYADLTRRRAMLSRLVALSAEAEPDDVHAQTMLCQSLADLQLYVLLSPLERLSAHPSPRVREAVMRVLAQFRYKRTFQTVRKALDDADPAVVQRAASAIEQLRFPVALDPISRIYRETSLPQARQAAIRAMAEIDRVEAAEMLLGILSHGSSEDRTCAVEALRRSRRKAFINVAKAALPDLDTQARKHVREVFQARGVAG